MRGQLDGGNRDHRGCVLVAEWVEISEESVVIGGWMESYGRETGVL